MKVQESLEGTLRASAEAGRPFNMILEDGAASTWVFAYRGPRRDRDRFQAALRPLGPFQPFLGGDQSPLSALQDQSKAAKGPVLGVSDSGASGTLFACYCGELATVQRLSQAADKATQGSAQPVHARAVDHPAGHPANSRPPRPKP